MARGISIERKHTEQLGRSATTCAQVAVAARRIYRKERRFIFWVSSSRIICYGRFSFNADHIDIKTDWKTQDEGLIFAYMKLGRSLRVDGFFAGT